MRIEVREAETSTSERPLWVWRVWCKGRVAQGFCPSEKEATTEAKLEQSRMGSHWTDGSRSLR